MNRFTDLALDKNALDFQDLFQEVLSQKVSDALDAKKVEIAATMFEDPAIAEEKIEMTRGGRATGNAIADIVAKNNARLAKKKADRAKQLRKKEKYDGGVKEDVESIDEVRYNDEMGSYNDSKAPVYDSLGHSKRRVPSTDTTQIQKGGKRPNMIKPGSQTLLKMNIKKRLNKEEVELDEGMVDHIAKVHVHGSNVTLHMDNGKKSTQKHPSPEAALKDGKSWHKATGREAKLVVSE
jgi:hypothetical protein